MKRTSYTKLEELLTAEKIKLYTYQNINVLSDLAKQGYLTGEHKFSYAKVPDEYGLNDFFSEPYEWMRKQMEKRIENFSGELPVWAWLESRGNINVKKRFGEEQVKITALVPLSRCLISDFDLYEGGVLNKMYYSTNVRKMKDQFEQINEKEYEERKELKIRYKFEPTKEDLEKGWELIFDLSKYIGTQSFRDYVGIDKEGRYLQVCVDRIYLNEITDIKVYDNILEKKSNISID